MVLVPGRWLFPPPRSPLLVSRSSIGCPTGGRPTILYGLKSIYLHALDNPLKNTGVLPGARSCAWSGSAPQSATGPRLPNPTERKNLNSSVLGAVIPGNLASISSEPVDSRRDAPTALVLGGTSHISVRGDLSPLEYRNDQPSPRRGGSPPPSRGLSPLLPLPPRGRGRSAKRGRGRGAALQSITSE